jgi:hypothetical protein
VSASRLLTAALDDLAKGLVELGIVNRQNRPAPELTHVAAEPEPAHRQRQEHVQPAGADAFMMEIGRHQPPEIEDPRRDHENRDLDEHLALPFDGAGQQQDERNREVKNHQPQPHEPPAGLDPGQVPLDLMRQVAAPDDEVLGKREIGPQHHEGEHQVAEVVKV